METIRYLFDPVLKILEHKFDIFGYTMSFMEIFILSTLATFAGVAISKLFGD